PELRRAARSIKLMSEQVNTDQEALTTLVSQQAVEGIEQFTGQLLSEFKDGIPRAHYQARLDAWAALRQSALFTTQFGSESLQSVLAEPSDEVRAKRMLRLIAAFTPGDALLQQVVSSALLLPIFGEVEPSRISDPHLLSTLAG